LRPRAKPLTKSLSRMDLSGFLVMDQKLGLAGSLAGSTMIRAFDPWLPSPVAIGQRAGSHFFATRQATVYAGSKTLPMS